jgi:hypothetical protein
MPNERDLDSIENTLPDFLVARHEFAVFARSLGITTILQESKVIKEPAEKPLGKREREKLLLIIAALVKHAGLDIKTPTKISEAIARWTQEQGMPVGARTEVVAVHLDCLLKKVICKLANRRFRVPGKPAFAYQIQYLLFNCMNSASSKCS